MCGWVGGWVFMYTNMYMHAFRQTSENCMLRTIKYRRYVARMHVPFKDAFLQRHEWGAQPLQHRLHEKASGWPFEVGSLALTWQLSSSRLLGQELAWERAFVGLRIF